MDNYFFKILPVFSRIHSISHYFFVFSTFFSIFLLHTYMLEKQKIRTTHHEWRSRTLFYSQRHLAERIGLSRYNKSNRKPWIKNYFLIIFPTGIFIWFKCIINLLVFHNVNFLYPFSNYAMLHNDKSHRTMPRKVSRCSEQ